MHFRCTTYGAVWLVFVVVSPSLRVTPGLALQQLEVERFSPSQLLRGQSTITVLAGKGLDAIQSVEISPSAGIIVVAFNADSARTENDRQASGLSWWQLILEVDKAAAPGKRQLVLVTSSGPSVPKEILIADHVPRISEVTVISMKPSIDLRISAFDAVGDLRNTVDVWFTIDCGGGFVSGIAPGKATAGKKGSSLVDVSIARPSASGNCALKVSVTDASGVRSDTFETRIDFQ